MLFMAWYPKSANCMGCIKRLFRDTNSIMSTQKKELGDLLWFVAEYCTAVGWDLDDIMALNIEKLKARFPDGFDPEKSLHRKEGDV